MTKLWQRYFALDMLKVVLLVLGSLYLLFVIIDYSLHTKMFAAADIPFSSLASYYGYQFSKRIELLLPFSLLLAGIKTLTTANIRGELIALLAAGLPKRRLLNPLLLIALLAAVALLINSQWFYPQAVSHIERFEDQHFHRKKAGRHSLNVLRLTDDSKILYQSYDSSKEAFIDAYWLKSPTEVVHMGLLFPHSREGSFVDILTKQEGGKFLKSGSHAHTPLDLQFDKADLFAALVPPENMPITSLYRHRPKTAKSDRDASITTYLNAKLAMPLVCLLAILAPAPFCLTFSRSLNPFFIYCAAIAGFLAYLTTFDAALILAKTAVLPPTLAIWCPLLSCGALFSYRYYRL